MSVKDKFMEKLRYYKAMLIANWEMGAEQGRAMQKSHKEKVNRIRRKENDN